MDNLASNPHDQTPTENNSTSSQAEVTTEPVLDSVETVAPSQSDSPPPVGTPNVTPRVPGAVDPATVKNKPKIAIRKGMMGRRINIRLRAEAGADNSIDRVIAALEEHRSRGGNTFNFTFDGDPGIQALVIHTLFTDAELDSEEMRNWNSLEGDAQWEKYSAQGWQAILPALEF